MMSGWRQLPKELSLSRHMDDFRKLTTADTEGACMRSLGPIPATALVLPVLSQVTQPVQEPKCPGNIVATPVPK